MTDGISFSSGGKDSILSLHLAHKNGINIKAMLTMIPEDSESMLYHTHNVSLVKIIAEVMGIEWISVNAPKNSEINALTKALKKVDAKYLITGGIESNYQKKKFDNVCEKVNMKHYAPLWGLNAKELYDNIITNKIDPIIVSVAALGLGKEWLGVHLKEQSINKLLELSEKYKFNAVGEGGDLDTLVLDAPLFSKKLKPSEVELKWYGDRGKLEINNLKKISK